jgi:hypothetical protein
MIHSMLTRPLCLVFMAMLAPLYSAAAQDKPGASDIEDALGVKLPSFLIASEVKIGHQAPDLNPGQVVFFLTQDWRPAIGVAQGQPFMKTTFSVKITVNEDLFVNDGQIGSRNIIRETIAGGQTILLNGIAASERVGNYLVTSVIGFDQNLPAGEPRSHFAPSAVLKGSPDELVALNAVKSARQARNQDATKLLLGVWSGIGFCNPNSAGVVAEINMIDITENGQIHAKYSFSSRPGMSYFPPGSWSMEGSYDENTKKIHFTPTEWIDRPNPAYQLVGFTLTLDDSQHELSGYNDITGPYSSCKGGHLSVKKGP